MSRDFFVKFLAENKSAPEYQVNLYVIFHISKTFGFRVAESEEPGNLDWEAGFEWLQYYAEGGPCTDAEEQIARDAFKEGYQEAKKAREEMNEKIVPLVKYENGKPKVVGMAKLVTPPDGEQMIANIITDDAELSKFLRSDPEAYSIGKRVNENNEYIMPRAEALDLKTDD